ncbi:MAG: ATP-binding protein, partial [Sciscionella sp.]
MPRLGSTIPLVARSAELETLRDALRRAEQGSGTAVLLSGDAGVGKSRLIQELSAHATTARALVLVGRCVDLGESGLPYLPFVE